MVQNEMKERIIDVAQGFVQSRGFNAFSYRDLAEQILIRTASIHYYFPKKDDLGRALIQRYRSDFEGAIQNIDRTVRSPKDRLSAYLKMFLDLSKGGARLCLFAVFSAELPSLSETVQEEIKIFYEKNVGWINKVIDEGRSAGLFSFPGESRDVAAAIFSFLEGEMLVRRVFQAKEPFPEIPSAIRILLSWTA
ncbi:MAG: TetR/AcrR family transcriptional regulator [Leptospirillum sp.]|jgi:TetR/AcrR family transcriptional repressor of nem operon